MCCHDKHYTYAFDRFALLFDGIDWHIGGANLLRNTAGLAVLHVGPSQFIQNLCFARIDVAQHTNDGRSQIVHRSLLFGRMLTFLGEQKIAHISKNHHECTHLI